MNWYDSDAALQKFLADPSLVAQAKSNPMEFYTKMTLDQGGRNTGQAPADVSPSGPDAALSANASKNGTGDVTAQAKAAAVPVATRAQVDKMNVIQTKITMLKDKPMPDHERARLQSKYLAEYRALMQDVRVTSQT